MALSRIRQCGAVDLRTDTNAKFYYLMRKFVFEGREHVYQLYSPIDIPLIRYADVLLLWLKR